MKSTTPTAQALRDRMARMIAARNDAQLRDDYAAAWAARSSLNDDLAAADFGTDARRELAADADALNLTMRMIGAEMDSRFGATEGRAIRVATIDR